MQIVGMIRTVVRTGNSLAFMLPPSYLNLLQDQLWVYERDGKIVYSHDRPDQAKAKLVKPRRILRTKKSDYYVLTIPSFLAQRLGLREGDSINIYILDGELVVERAPPVHNN